MPCVQCIFSALLYLLERLVVHKTCRILRDIELPLLDVLSELPDIPPHQYRYTFFAATQSAGRFTYMVGGGTGARAWSLTSRIPKSDAMCSSRESKYAGEEWSCWAAFWVMNRRNGAQLVFMSSLSEAPEAVEDMQEAWQRWWRRMESCAAHRKN